MCRPRGCCRDSNFCARGLAHHDQDGAAEVEWVVRVVRRQPAYGCTSARAVTAVDRTHPHRDPPPDPQWGPSPNAHVGWHAHKAMRVADADIPVAHQQPLRAHWQSKNCGSGVSANSDDNFNFMTITNVNVSTSIVQERSTNCYILLDLIYIVCVLSTSGPSARPCSIQQVGPHGSSSQVGYLVSHLGFSTLPCATIPCTFNVFLSESIFSLQRALQPLLHHYRTLQHH